MAQGAPAHRGSILVVEDDPLLGAMIVDLFRDRGYLTALTPSAAEAARLMEERHLDLVLLDLMLEDGTGHELCGWIRSHPARSATPVIILSALSELDDKRRGILNGADYYLTKPMPMEELLLWVRAMLRRASGDWARGTAVGVPGLRVHVESRLVVCEGETVRGLTAKEFLMLCELAKECPKALRPEQLMLRVWGGFPSSNTLEAHISSLRRKLGPRGATHLATLPGPRYRLE